ncbi:hypothetical protein J1N35_011555 [Gossypium stocksii]|uniref:Uncharacterized protein n=1 Tax=Gossypium stocksii TaxID=47602 RepID=A0A9D4ABK8_9ROSI|nr:hypothetical protein J1N35_011555 [Gossypium stocksii]
MRQQRRMKRTCAAWIVASVSALIAYPHIAFTGFCRLVHYFTQSLPFSSELVTDDYDLNWVRHILLTVLKWCSSRRGLKTGNSKALETTVLLVTEVFKTLLSIALWAASPDFLIPQGMGVDEMTNETPHSTVADSNEPQSLSSGSDNTSMAMAMAMAMAYNSDQHQIVRKKRSGLYLCGRSASKVSDEDMATSMSRRKGIPQRSPLC